MHGHFAWVINSGMSLWTCPESNECHNDIMAWMSNYNPCFYVDVIFTYISNSVLVYIIYVSEMGPWCSIASCHGVSKLIDSINVKIKAFGYLTICKAFAPCDWMCKIYKSTRISLYGNNLTTMPAWDVMIDRFSANGTFFPIICTTWGE